jgi:regulator of cell morphogenesis and NO signaling
MAIQISPDATVADVAVLNPGVTRVFEQYGIDYCCGGRNTIREATGKAGIALEELMQSLDRNCSDAVPASERDWNQAPLGELITHILDAHHVFIRRESPRIEGLLAKVVNRHGANHPELNEMQDVFGAMSQELAMHLMKEEQVLFPLIERLIAGAPAPMPLHCPVSRMFEEHEDAGELLQSLRRLTSNYTPPPEACMSYRALYQALEEFEHDLHQHIHLENNILFPKAIRLEESVG